MIARQQLANNHTVISVKLTLKPTSYLKSQQRANFYIEYISLLLDEYCIIDANAATI